MITCSKFRFPVLLIALAFVLSLNVEAETVRPLTPDCEAALALSALPDHLQAGASVWILGASGYWQQRQGNGPFNCLLERNHQDSLIPQCLDEPGTRAMMPRFLLQGEWLRSELEYADIAAQLEQSANDKAFAPADRPGLVYMMSAFNYIWAPQQQQMLHIPPHVMFHAPYLTVEDVGNDMSQAMHNTGLPFVQDNGVHGYMISFVDQASSAEQVILACGDQLPAPP